MRECWRLAYVATSIALVTTMWWTPPVMAETIVVVISNKNYAEGVGHVEFAHRDADALTEILTKNRRRLDPYLDIYSLSDITLAQFQFWFGHDQGIPDKLALLVHNETDVLVYYSGHGVPGLNNRGGYLLPVDGNPDMAEHTGYPLDLMMANLEALDARSVVLLIDAGLSGFDHTGRIVKGLSGPMEIIADSLAPESRLSVLTAASGAPTASWDMDARRGLFTRYLLTGLAGAADRPPWGNGDGRILVMEIKAWPDREMTRAAYELYGRTQTTGLFGNDTSVLTIPPSIVPCPDHPETAERTCWLLEEGTLTSKVGNRNLVYRMYNIPEYEIYMNGSNRGLRNFVTLAYSDRPDHPFWNSFQLGSFSYFYTPPFARYQESSHEFFSVTGNSGGSGNHIGTAVFVGGAKFRKRVYQGFYGELKKDIVT